MSQIYLVNELSQQPGEKTFANKPDDFPQIVFAAHISALGLCMQPQVKQLKEITRALMLIGDLVIFTTRQQDPVRASEHRAGPGGV